MTRNQINQMKKAFAKYGFDFCKYAFEENEAGEGSSNISDGHKVNGKDMTRSQCDAAINAYRTYTEL